MAQIEKSFTLRPATQADQKAIKALIREVGINPMGLDWRRFVVAVDEAGQLIGCGQVKPHRDGTRELASIAVRKGWRRQGVARAIIERLQEEHGRPLWLTCVDRLVPFYEPFGFVEVADLDQMTAYYRRAKRFMKLFQLLSRQPYYLAVMVWAEEKMEAYEYPVEHHS
ncbi:MAG: GNAT family N-acetyltransferase [Anaerolineae bacterium]|nr:GNAT family N-acetyltransferase [Anaerolineae bacterium]